MGLCGFNLICHCIYSPTYILNMTLQVKGDWFNFFCNADIPTNKAQHMQLHLLTIALL